VSDAPSVGDSIALDDSQLADPPSEASVRVLNSILHARVPEESILRDYDEE